MPLSAEAQLPWSLLALGPSNLVGRCVNASVSLAADYLHPPALRASHRAHHHVGCSHVAGRNRVPAMAAVHVLRGILVAHGPRACALPQIDAIRVGVNSVIVEPSAHAVFFT